MENAQPMKDEDFAGVDIRLDLVSSLYLPVEANKDLAALLSGAVARAVDELLREIGLPGRAQVAIGEWKPGVWPSGQFFRLSRGDLRLRYPDFLPGWVYAYVTGQLTGASIHLENQLKWLETYCQNPQGNEEISEPVQEYFYLACREILTAQPGCLAGREQVEAFRDALPLPASPQEGTPSWPPGVDWLHAVIQTVVSMGISVADGEQVGQVLYQYLHRPASEAAEALIAVLRPQQIEIHIPESYLRELTLISDSPMAPFMRDGLFVELGVTYPNFRLVLDEDIRPFCFAFRLNHLLRLPVAGLQPHEILVNDTPDRLALTGVAAAPTLNPATQQPGAIVSGDQKAMLEAQGLTTWTPDGFLILAMANLLRKNAYQLMDINSAQAVLDILQKAFPEVVRCAQAQLSIETITGVLRGLLKEEISIRNLRRILERLLDEPISRQVSARFLLLDDRPTLFSTPVDAQPGEPERLLAFVRAGLKDYISFKISRATKTVVVYLLDQKMEQMITALAAANLEEPGVQVEVDDLIRAVRKEMSFLPRTAQTPAILTTTQARFPARKFLGIELPQVAVISYDDLLPDYNVQPVARISLVD